MRLPIFLLTFLIAVVTSPSFAVDAEAVRALGFGDGDEKVAAISKLVTEGDPRGAKILEALAGGDLKTAGKAVLIIDGGNAIDAITGEKLAAMPEGVEDIVANNRQIGRAHV